MKRRAVLGGVGSALAFGSAGCSMLSGDDSREFRFWFVRVLNGQRGPATVAVRLRSGSTALLEKRYERFPGRAADRTPDEATFACEPNVRLLEDEWSGEQGSYEIDYAVGELDPWEELDFDAGGVDDVAVDLHVVPGSSGPRVNYQVLEFESPKQASDLLREVTSECGE